MAEIFKPEPVMHCTADECVSVYNLSKNLIESGMYKNLVEFPAIPEDVLTYTADIVLLGNLLVSSKGNTNLLEDRDAQAIVVFNKTWNNLRYAKIVCGNVIHLIHLSGFPSSEAPVAATVPITREIKTIIKGFEAATVRIVLEPATGTEKEKKQRKTYVVLVFATETSQEQILGCTSSNSTKLICKNVPDAVGKYYKVLIQNAAGTNEMGTRKKFTLNY